MKKLFKFYIDEKNEYNDLFGMITGDTDITNSVNRAAQYAIPLNIAQDKTGTLLKQFLHDKYKTYSQELKQALCFHKSYISKNNKHIYQQLKLAFNHDIPQYSVRLNMQIAGMSDWYGTDISIYAFDYVSKWKENNMLLSLIWETALSQTFIDIRKKYTKKQICDKKVWAISELTAIAIWKKYFSEYDWNSVNVGYPELIKHQTKISKLYETGNGFDTYLDNAVKLFKQIKL
ncbi:MAG: hypothetical protein MJ170_00285 [Alphaproteobacteria bacterium]|nr:hypothetical protein [Alphaproteobacteria bacterium]